MNDVLEQALIARAREKQRERLFRKLRSKAATAFKALDEAVELINAGPENQGLPPNTFSNDFLAKLIQCIQVSHMSMRMANDHYVDQGQTLQPPTLPKAEPKPRFRKGPPANACEHKEWRYDGNRKGHVCADCGMPD